MLQGCFRTPDTQLEDFIQREERESALTAVPHRESYSHTHLNLRQLAGFESLENHEPRYKGCLAGQPTATFRGVELQKDCPKTNPYELLHMLKRCDSYSQDNRDLNHKKNHRTMLGLMTIWAICIYRTIQLVIPLRITTVPFQSIHTYHCYCMNALTIK